MAENDFKEINDLLKSDRISRFLGALVLLAFTFTGYSWMTSGTGSALIADIVNNESVSSSEVTPQTESNTVQSIVVPDRSKEVPSDVQTLLNNSQEDSEPEIKAIRTDEGGETVVSQHQDLRLVAMNYPSFIHLEWREQDVPGNNFVVEKSTDQVHFEEVDEKSQTIPSASGDRSFLDINYPSSQMVYLRLKEENEEGEIKYSPVVAVSCNVMQSRAPEIDVFPIGSGTFKITVNSEEVDTFSVTLHDLNEIEIMNEKYEATEGFNVFIFKSGSIPRGNYSLKVSNGEFTREKIVSLK